MKSVDSVIKGTMNRKQFIAANLAVLFVVVAIAIAAKLEAEGMVVLALVSSLITMVFDVKRLHDMGITGAWAVAILGLNGVNASVPADSVLCYVTGGITLVIFLYFCIAKGKQENNPFAV